jgi:pimeloyl-ACP methyl ester carboxylesterase
MIRSALHVEDSGAGEPVLLLHSSGFSGRQWRRLASRLVEGGKRVLVPDLSGHGASPPWPEPTPFTFLADVARVAEILAEGEPARVVGHSYGGLIALHAALAAPRSVRSLALYDPVVFGGFDPQEDADALAALGRLDLTWGSLAADRERWLRTFVDFWTGGDGWGALREDARAEFRRVAWVIREGVRTMVEDATPFRAFGDVRLPVRLVTGERSPLPAARVVQRLAEAIAGARVQTIGGAGHLAPVTHADAVNAVLLDALA